MSGQNPILVVSGLDNIHNQAEYDKRDPAKSTAGFLQTIFENSRH